MRTLPLLATIALSLSLVACGDKEGGGGAGDVDTGSAGSDGSDGSDGADDTDADGDGFTAADDCDDDDAAVNPGAAEVCDGIDNNCDGLADDEDPAVDLSTGTVWYQDDDGDSYGQDDSTVEACAAPEGHAEAGGDCDDGEAAVNPAATEVCDGIDNNCDALIDDADPALDTSTATLWYPDADGDTFGDSAAAGTPYCADPSTDGDTWLTDNTDCDDAVAEVNPGATEVCDELDIDEDCSGDADNADPGVDTSTQTLFYIDDDTDGYGDVDDSGTLYCDAVSGTVTDNTDCDDATTEVNPGATEVCDELDVDEDCSGAADDADAGVDTATQTLFYVDSDGDGYGDLDDSGTLYCDPPTGVVTDNTDCDDLDAAVSPAATELCDGIDNDCDSSTSEDGLATFVDSASTVTDYTATLTGSSTAPATATLATDGQLAVCDGTWYVNLDVAASVELWNPSGDPADVVLDGAGTGSVIMVSTDGITVSLMGLSLENGQGSGDSDPYSGAGVNGGAIDCLATGTLISASAVDIENNAAIGAGGGISSNGCDLELEDMVIANNDADFGGGIFLTDADLLLSDSVVSDNTADAAGGGIDVYGGEGPASAELDEVEVTDNTAYWGGGLAVEDYGYGASATCAGSSSSDAGFTGNSATYGGGVYLFGEVDFDSDTCDFGTSSGGDDNSIDDVYSSEAGESYTKDDDESFTCVDGICGTEIAYSFGASGSTYTDTNFYIGNVVLADADMEIDSFSATLSTTSSACLADFYVMSNSSATETGWTVLAASTGNAVSSTLATVDSGPLGITTASGTYYALVVGTTCTTTGLDFEYASGLGTTDAGFGTLQGYIYENDYLSTFSASDSVDAQFYATSYSYAVDVTLIEY